MKSFRDLTREQSAWLVRRRRRDRLFVLAWMAATSFGLLVLGLAWA